MVVVVNQNGAGEVPFCGPPVFQWVSSDLCQLFSWHTFKDMCVGLETGYRISACVAAVEIIPPPALESPLYWPALFPDPPLNHPHCHLTCSGRVPSSCCLVPRAFSCLQGWPWCTQCLCACSPMQICLGAAPPN